MNLASRDLDEESGTAASRGRAWPKTAEATQRNREKEKQIMMTALRRVEAILYVFEILCYVKPRCVEEEYRAIKLV